MVSIALTSRLRILASRTRLALAATSCAALGATTQFAAGARSESAFWNGTRWKVVLTA